MLSTIIAGWEMVVILAVLVILLLAKRLPEIGKGLGNGLSQFRKHIDNQAHDAGESLGGIYGKAAAEALTPDNQTAELYDPAAFQHKSASRGRIRTWFRRLLMFGRRIWSSVLQTLLGKR